MADRLPVIGRPPAAAGPKDLDRENAVLRELVTVYRHLSGLALQDADLASIAQLISDRTAATGRGAARPTGVELAAELLAEARPIVGGVVLTAPDEDATGLLPLLDVVS
jgi:hypothetical protein